MDLIRAQSDLALQAASQQLEGGLGRAAESLREELIQLVAQVEAYIDFPEEDIDPDTGSVLKARMDAVQQRFGALLDTAEQGRILRSGARTVICGAPNVGKSSLLNALSGHDRAIVSPHAGTTRDTIEEVLHIHGLPFVLVDTAGLRTHTSDFIESLGMDRTRRELGRADVIVEVVDSHSSPDSAHRVPVSPGRRGHLLVLNKTDLGMHPAWQATGGLTFSCKTGTGIDALRAAMRDAVWNAGSAGDAPLVAINARHQRSFQRAAEALADAADAFDHDQAPEIIAFELREALQAVGEVSGRVDAEEVLGAIFARFCVGK
jgi:tRNA modification GTPase